MRFEIKKNFLSRRAFLLYLIAGLPLVLLSLFVVFEPPGNEQGSFSELGNEYAAIYGGLILRTLIFFGCAWVFMNLFRGEVIDRSLHYYFLAPVRREVLVVGKYLSGLIATIALFSITTVGSMFIYYFCLSPSESARFFFDGAGSVKCWLTLESLASRAWDTAQSFCCSDCFSFSSPSNRYKNSRSDALRDGSGLNFLLPHESAAGRKISVLGSLTLHPWVAHVPVPISKVRSHGYCSRRNKTKKKNRKKKKKQNNKKQKKKNRRRRVDFRPMPSLLFYIYRASAFSISRGASGNTPQEIVPQWRFSYGRRLNPKAMSYEMNSPQARKYPLIND
jgi:hypothetical protein